jgi:hypothetical protein
MSYARNNGTDSDVYVIQSDKGFECFCKDHFICETEEEMIVHLIQHLRNGEKVPNRTFERFIREIKENNEQEKDD